MEFEKLKNQLEAFHTLEETSTDESIQQKSISCSQHAIQKYIENKLRGGTEVERIRSDMESLFSVHHVVPQLLLRWSLEEVDVIYKKLMHESKVVKPSSEIGQQKSVLFSKDTLYHASLCCEALSDSMPLDHLSFFRDKKPHHNLTEVSFSQSRDDITPYLIARQKDVIYVAFKSTPEVLKWLEKTSSFNEGQLFVYHEVVNFSLSLL